MVAARKLAKAMAAELGLGLLDQTKVMTAASELARNTLDYGLGGDLKAEEILEGMRRGLRLTFSDQGPGIADLAKALTDGYTTGGGMGMGLSGSKRLMSEFEIESKPGQGTTIVVIKWK